MYALVLRVMFLVAPERIHHIAFALMRIMAAVAPLRWITRRLLRFDDPVLQVNAFGVSFPGPFGLAAGFDKDGRGIEAWEPLGFGFAEVGTVTAHAQPGNPQPRLFRVPADRALINRMGFNNLGAEAAADRLRARRTRLPIGANIGKTKVVPSEDAAADYRESARLLGPLADFLVVNVSSPNTPGLRDLQAVSSLRPVLEAVLSVVSVPVLVKIAPDLADDDVDAVADLALELGLAGIVATNTTISRDGLATDVATIEAIGAGGLSGAPLRQRSVEVLRRLRARVGNQIVLVSVGGIESVDDAWERITAGATLIQGYTGLIYGGPCWPGRIHRGLARKIRDSGYQTVSEAIGSSAT